MSPVTGPDPDPRCLVDLTRRMTMIVVARLVDIALVVTVIVIEVHHAVATMMMNVGGTVLLLELVVPLMIIHLRVAGSRILIVVIIPLILTSMAGLLMIDPHQGITHQETILQRTMIALAAIGMLPLAIYFDYAHILQIASPEAAMIRSAILMKGALLHKRSKTQHHRNDCDMDNEFSFRNVLAGSRFTKAKHSLVIHAGGMEWSMYNRDGKITSRSTHQFVLHRKE